MHDIAQEAPRAACLSGPIDDPLSSGVDSAQDHDVTLTSTLMLVAESIDAGLVFLARPEGDYLHIDRALDRAGMGLHDGENIPLDDTYCQTLLTGDAPMLMVENARADPHFASLATTKSLGIGSYSGVRLTRPDGRPYGTLCALHPTARVISVEEMTLLALAGRLLMQGMALEEGRARERALQIERDATARTRALYEALTCGLITLDGDGRILDINPAGVALMGVADHVVRGRLLSEAPWSLWRLDGSDLPISEQPAVMMLRTGQPYSTTLQLRRPNGDVCYVQIDGAPLDAKGGVEGTGVHPHVIVSYTDVTARVVLEHNLAQGQQRYRSLVHHNPDAVFALDLDGAFTAANDACAALTGYPVATLPTLSFFALIVLGDQARIVAQFARAVQGEPQREIELSVRHKDGGTRTVSGTLIPIVVDGAIVGVYGIAKDITARHQAEEALRTSEERFRSLARVAPDAIISADGDDVIMSWNNGAERMFGYAEDDARSFPLVKLMPERFRKAHGDSLKQATATGTSSLVGRTIELTGLHRDGAEFPMELSLAMWATSKGHFYSAVIRDITDRKRAEDALRASEEDYRHLFEQASDAILIVDPANDIVLDVNTRACTLYGYAHNAFVGLSMSQIRRDSSTRNGHVRAAVEELGASEYESVHQRADGTTFAVAVTATPLVFQGRAALLCFNRDITARKDAEAALLHQATHDALTDLPNRILLDDHLARLIRPEELDEAFPRKDAGEACQIALLLLDLDGFKEVNDTFGRPQGDILLRQVSARLRGALRTDDLVARLGGDEFAVVLAGGDEAAAVRAAAGVRAALDSPFSIEEQVLRIDGSIGIALYPNHGTDAATLMRHADVALYAAKRGRRGMAVYHAEEDGHSPKRLALVGQLRAAIEGNALTLHYQPQIDLVSGRVRGVEALARWLRPDAAGGVIPPDVFIPLAEKTGSLTRWALATALHRWSTWRQAGFLLTLSVNLSVWDLHDASLPDLIAGLLRDYDVPPAWLRLEVTESAMMADPDRAHAVLDRLHRLGVGLAVDDFGAGYSSLAYLKRLPVDELKIDKAFVQALATDRRDAAIVAAAVGLGHALDLRVVAEGVEDVVSLEQLGTLGCDTVQGHHLSPPLEEDALMRWLRESPFAPTTPRLLHPLSPRSRDDRRAGQ